MRHLVPASPTWTLIAVFFLAPVAHASGDGKLAFGSGASSSASAQVGLVVEDMVKVSDLDDLMLQWDEAQQAFSAEDGLCVFRNLSGSYSVSANSTKGNGSFVMTGEADSTVPYEVNWNGQALSEGTRSAVRSDADTTQVDCGGDSNMTLSVRASAEQAGAASRTGVHTDTLVLEIIAE